MEISADLLAELKAKQENIAAEIMPLLQGKDYLQQLVDPAMLPLIAASFMQSLNAAMEVKNLDSFRNTVDWLFQMAAAKQLERPLEKFMDFLATVEGVVKHNVSEAYQDELGAFTAEVKEIFQEAAKLHNA